MKFSDLKLTTPYLELPELFYHLVEPMPLKKPYLIAASQSCGELLGIDEDLSDDEKLVQIVNGNEKLAGSKTFAMCYAGHQFGYFVPRLGDGRAINLGKVNGQNLQLKGSGLTRYSREGDGRAVKRSSIREFLMSEAMYGLGIATSRALALIGSDTDVARERLEKGAMVLRVSPTWIRFGTFEYFKTRREYEKLQLLADYVIEESFPELQGQEDRYFKMFSQIVENSAKTVARWQSVGFNHGVMNTDNMSIDGRTIDYGPYAMLDDYEVNYICNHTDVEGRYSFKNQPSIMQWNLSVLANALSPMVNIIKMSKLVEKDFISIYESEYLELMKNKMGLFEEDENDVPFIRWMLGSLESSVVDYSRFFRTLSHYSGDKAELLALCEYETPLQEWLEAYDERVQKEQLSQAERSKKMLQTNPKFVLKNHLLQKAIEKEEEGDFTMIEDLLKVVLDPFSEHEALEYLNIPTPPRSKNLKLSCSS
ncbi:protein adenylyltransferase SelO [Sulfurimonas microaerophilic]|uniref:protein adenylyltransferase SelO n=1 Tax=Sulfurimonas microaerophilic TaxID=3058392 RepID=UPI002714EF52|nr:YdiU family protein [Sulfurimonas sp. hsl 1-7]